MGYRLAGRPYITERSCTAGGLVPDLFRQDCHNRFPPASGSSPPADHFAGGLVPIGSGIFAITASQWVAEPGAGAQLWNFFHNRYSLWIAVGGGAGGGGARLKRFWHFCHNRSPCRPCAGMAGVGGRRKADLEAACVPGDRDQATVPAMTAVPAAPSTFMARPVLRRCLLC
jgi:hypothetical protein